MTAERTEGPAERAVVVERWIAAAPDTVFEFFMTTEAWLSWQGVGGTIDARPGGVFRVAMRAVDDFVSGHFLEVTPPLRLVFTWGWEGGERAPYPVPPGASTVEIDLAPEAGGTLLRLTHRIEGDQLTPLVEQGWTHYLERLTTRAEGRDPGPDPAAA